MKHKGIERKTNRWGWIFVSLSIFLITLFVFYPTVQSFITSLKSGMGNNLKFVGLDNYKRMLTDATFIKAIFLPCVTSLVAYSIIMKSIFASDGLVNKFLMAINIISGPIEWVTHPIWAKVLIIIAITWRWTGYNMIFYLSGLQNIDPAVYEAASIDGASTFKKFTKITIPLLKPIILFTTITSTIGTLQLFDEVVNITNGGPANATTTISHYIYNLCFTYTPNFGYAAAVAYVIVIMIVILSLIQFKIGGDSNE